MNINRVSVFLAVFVLFSAGSLHSKPPKKNVDAKRVAKAIPKFNPKQAKPAGEQQLRQLIHVIALAKREGLSANQSLVRTAFDFRNDIGEHQKTISAGAIMKAWDTATSYGAVTGNQFTIWASKGRYDGEELVFENIVPAEMLPECKGYIGNLRIVPESLARKPGAPLDPRDQAYLAGLKQVLHETKTIGALKEIEKSKVKGPGPMPKRAPVGNLGLSKSEEEEKWQAEVAEAGDLVKQAPGLQLSAQRMGTPAKINGFRNKLRVDITNVSRYPTQVEIESTIVGYTENGNKLYELRRDTRTLKLRRAQNVEYLIQSPPVSQFKKPLIKFDPKKSQRVNYRGYTVVARFQGRVVAAIGSDARLQGVADGEDSPPAVILGASRKK